TSDIGLVSEFVRTIESFFTYQVIRWWADWYASNPASFLIGVILLGVLIWFGSRLGAKINDTMRLIWKQPKREPFPNDRLAWALYRFRTSNAYQRFLGILKRSVLPFLAAVVMLLFGMQALTHLAFNVVDSTGAFCVEKVDSEKNLKPDQSKVVEFKTR